MAKRSYPYSEDYVPQIKVHIGEKQFRNNGKRLQEVYEKTLDLLYQGARKCCSGSSQEMLLVTDLDSLHNKKRKFKQLQIGRNGFLEPSEKTMDVAEVVSHTCVCGGACVSERCAYCETHLCAACIHPCGRCQHTYCNKCVLYRSDGYELCVSCS